MSLWSRMANVFRGDRLNRDIDEELQTHIEEALARGRDPDEVRRAFGSVLRHREQSRDIRLITWLMAGIAAGRRPVWLAPDQQGQGDFRRRDLVTRSGDRRLHGRLPP